jgi:hypothetical protein
MTPRRANLDTILQIARAGEDPGMRGFSLWCIADFLSAQTIIDVNALYTAVCFTLERDAILREDVLLLMEGHLALRQLTT